MVSVQVVVHETGKEGVRQMPLRGSLTPDLAFICPAFQKARVFRSKSLCHDIESILDSDHRELIGDYSKVELRDLKRLLL